MRYIDCDMKRALLPLILTVAFVAGTFAQSDSMILVRANGSFTNDDQSYDGERVDWYDLQAPADGRISATALDVVEGHTSLGPDHELCAMDNVILTPHSAWLSADSFEQCKNDLTNEIVRFFKNQPLKALLNPEVLDQPSN